MQVKNAGFFVRSLALIQDSLLNFLLLTAPFILFTSNMGADDFLGKIVNALTFALIFVFLSAPLQALYYSYFTSKFGGTIGKLIFGLRVLDKDTVGHIEMKRAFFRYIIGYAFSAKFFFMGFLRIFKNKEKLTWHDEMFNTKVVSEGKMLLGVIILITTLLLIGFVFYVNLNNIGILFS